MLYESGVFNGVQLARHYGVHRDVIYRHLKSVRATKDKRADEAARELNDELTKLRTRELMVQWKREEHQLDQFIASGNVVERFMLELIQADRDGTLLEFGAAMKRFSR